MGGSEKSGERPGAAEARRRETVRARAEMKPGVFWRFLSFGAQRPARCGSHRDPWQPAASGLLSAPTCGSFSTPFPVPVAPSPRRFQCRWLLLHAVSSAGGSFSMLFPMVAPHLPTLLRV
ncbi:uncharacterized protein LOC114210232 isoform X2 [Eumetopias jubatus]|uniref:uncharacterized protein LOC114210232 isoform X2 n=1 Tax=Eumetopias jubatus TaxID=34886 RepID=UPI001015E390|nr:uncharacterized protein LOC114210232 isoform X2 [Eumetopias jubatus]